MLLDGDGEPRRWLRLLPATPSTPTPSVPLRALFDIFVGVVFLDLSPFTGVFLPFPMFTFMSMSHARVLSSTFSSSTYSRNMWFPCAPDPVTCFTKRAILSIAASIASRPELLSELLESSELLSLIPSPFSLPSPPSNLTNKTSMFFLMLLKIRSSGVTTNFVV